MGSVAGGFARSPLLTARLKDNFKNTCTKLFVTRQPDLAIVKGAAAFTDVIESRKARYTYGVGATVLFEDDNPVHQQHEFSKYLATNGRWSLRVFNVHGQVGDDIEGHNSPPRCRYLPLTEEQDEVTFKVLVTKCKKVFLEDKPGVQELCRYTVQVDRSLPRSERKYEVLFSFSGTEAWCKFYRYDGRGFSLIESVEVKFPIGVHWLNYEE